MKNDLMFILGVLFVWLVAPQLRSATQGAWAVGIGYLLMGIAAVGYVIDAFNAAWRIFDRWQRRPR